MPRITTRYWIGGLALLSSAAAVAVGPATASAPSGAAATTASGVEAWGSTPSAPAGTVSTLRGVAAAASDDVVAVGAYNPGEPPTAVAVKPYAEHWNGAKWTATPVADPGYFRNQIAELTAAAAPGRADAWAVGYAEDINSLAARTLAYHWDGTAWTRATTPNPAGPDNANRLTAVAARGPADVWAVGYYGSDVEKSLLLHWDGTSWSKSAVPELGKLISVSVDANSVWVAGQSSVARLTSSGWTRLPTPPPAFPGQDARLYAIASSGGRLWAVGDANPQDYGGYPSDAYATYWNGVRWTVVKPPPGIEYELLSVTATADGVAATSADTVVQFTTSGSSAAVTPANTGTSLDAITHDPSGRRWAVGNGPTIFTAPAVGQGGLIVESGYSHGLVTWLGPVNATVEADDSGRVHSGGLPVGTYTVVSAAVGCTPGVQKVTVQQGVAATVNAPVHCGG